MGRQERSFPEISFYSQHLKELKPPENLTVPTFMPIKLRLFPNSVQPNLFYISLSSIHLYTAREMKIQCDVCGKEEAYVFCTSDEAALCQACDCRVHRANKLASKHPRFSLLHPSSIDSPRCDICLERRALLFCQEDRALLCRECDIPIHKANEYTKNHNRFLLTGIKLSAFAASYQASTSFSTNGSNNANKIVQTNSNVKTSESTSTSGVHNHGSDQSGSQDGYVSTSSISEYLIETLPGWHVEDLLDPSSPAFCKINGQIISASTNDDEVESNFDHIFI